MSKIKTTIAVFVLIIGFSAISGVSAKESSSDKTLYMIDVLHLQPGVKMSRARTYFSRVMPVVAKHGLMRVRSFTVINEAGNPKSTVSMINIWTMSGKSTMPGIMSDPNYQKNVKFRNGTFDMSKTKMFMLMPNR